MDTDTDLYSENLELLGLGRQIGLKKFGVYLAKLSALIWHLEFLVFDSFFYGKNFGFQV